MNRMNLWMLRRSLLLFIPLLVWCAPAHAQAEATGTVWFYRDIDPSILDPTLFKIVPSFAERLAVLKPNSYFALEVPAGVHSFSWTAAPAKGETLSIPLAAGQQVFVKVQFRGMSRVEQREAKGRMQRMEPITAPLAFDARVSRRNYLPPPSPEPIREASVSGTALPRDGLIAPDLADAVTVDKTEAESANAEPPAEPAAESPAPAPGLAPASASVSDVLINEDIVMMVRAGLSRELVAAKIRSSKTDFETNPSELVALKKAGVHESIIMLMIDSGSGPAPPSPPAPATTTPAATPPATTTAPDSWTSQSGMMSTDHHEQEAALSPPLPMTEPVVTKPSAEPSLVAALDNRPLRRLSEPPKIISQPQVVYPEEARKNGVQGLVEVDVVMRPGGEVIGLQLVSSPHSALSETALQSVSQWQFEPAPPDNSNADVVFRVVLKFTIE